jgi:hypothetical protein
VTTILLTLTFNQNYGGKNMKKILSILMIPASLIILTGAYFMIQSFSIPEKTGEGDEKKVKIKMIKIIDGIETVVDTTFIITDDSELDAILAGLDPGASGCNLDSIIQTIDLDLEIDDNGEKQVKMVIKVDGEEQIPDIDSLLGTFDILIDENDLGGEKEYTIKINGNDTVISKSCEKKVIITMDEGETLKEGNKKVKVMIDDEGSDSKNWDVINDKDGHVYVINKENGDSKIIVRNTGETVCNKNEVTIIKMKDGKDIKVVESKVCIVMLSESDAKTLEKSGVETNKVNDLEVTDLNIFPNPGTGSFNMKFSLNNKEKTEIKIFDINGKEVYKENIDRFDGEYNNQIDISDKGKGTFFINIRQGDKLMNKKIIIE